MTLAFPSSYCHRVFQSRESIQNVDMVFVVVKPFLIHEALRMMYFQTNQIAEKHLERFCVFLQLLKITFETSVAEGDDKAV